MIDTIEEKIEVGKLGQWWICHLSCSEMVLVKHFLFSHFFSCFILSQFLPFDPSTCCFVLFLFF